MVDRTDDREPVHDLRLAGKPLGDADPGAAVAIGRYGPRNSAGASGFMSYVSCWLMPPCVQKTISDRCSHAAVAGCARLGSGAGSALGQPMATPRTIVKPESQEVAAQPEVAAIGFRARVTRVAWPHAPQWLNRNSFVANSDQSKEP